jgi:hypothetical protein
MPIALNLATYMSNLLGTDVDTFGFLPRNVRETTSSAAELSGIRRRCRVHARSMPDGMV